MGRDEIRLVTEAESSRWDAFVAKHPLGRGLIAFHAEPWWNASGWSLHRLALVKGDAITAGIVVGFKKMPYLSSCVARVPAILTDEADRSGSIRVLLEAAEQLAVSHRALEVEVRCRIYRGVELRGCRYDVVFNEALLGAGYVPSGTNVNTYLIRIDQDDESLLQSFNRKCRQDVGRGLRRGVVVACSEDPEDLRVFADTHRSMVKRKGLAPLPDARYEAVKIMVQHRCWRLFVARYEDRIQNMVACDPGGTPCATLAAATEHTVTQDASLSGQVMYFRVMQWMRDHGAAWFDFSGAPGPIPVEGHPNFHVWRFKYRFNPLFVEGFPYYVRSLGLAGKVLRRVARRLGKLPT